jgi:hypothetical protein
MSSDFEEHLDHFSIREEACKAEDGGELRDVASFPTSENKLNTKTALSICQLHFVIWPEDLGKSECFCKPIAC